jgi:hypothetical protein
MKQKTAIQHLYDVLEQTQSVINTDNSTMQFMLEAKEGLLEMEKQQIIEARKNGSQNGIAVSRAFEWGQDHNGLTDEEYYNETYKP